MRINFNPNIQNHNYNYNYNYNKLSKENVLQKQSKNLVTQDLIPVYSPNFLGRNKSDLNLLKDMSKLVNPDFSYSIENKYAEHNIEDYIKSTYGVYSDKESKYDEKLNGFAKAYSMVKENSSKAEDLTKDFKNSVKISLEKGNTIYSYIPIKKIFGEAAKNWQENCFPKIEQMKSEKEEFIKSNIDKCPQISKSKTFQSLDVDDRFFVVNYFKNNNFKKFADEPMTRILNDRSIENKSEILKKVQKKMDICTLNFKNRINSIPLLIKNNDSLKELTEDKTFMNIYMRSFDKKDNEAQLDEYNFRNFLEIKTPEELHFAGEKAKHIWENDTIVKLTNDEITYQAYKNDIQVKLKEELKKINENLSSINIKLDKTNLSLLDLISGTDNIYAELKNPPKDVEELKRKSNLYLESTKQIIDKASPQEQERIAKSFKTEGVKYLDLIYKNTKDEKAKLVLEEIKRTINTEKAPKGMLNRLSDKFSYLFIGSLFRGGASKHLSVGGISRASLDSAIGDDLAKNTIFADSAAAGGGILSAITTPEIMVAIAVTIGLYRLTKNTIDLHKQFDDMYFGDV